MEIELEKMKNQKFTIVIPYYNEVESLPKLKSELKNLKMNFEVIWADDGSVDGSTECLKKQSFGKLDFSEKYIRHHKRLGKGKSLIDAIKMSETEIVVFLDADGQDDPTLIKYFLEKIESGADLVNGWRQKRIDATDKTVPSSFANKFLWQKVLKTKLHDVNCGFKAMRKSIFEVVPIYGDNYRFLPILAEKSGFLVDEVKVDHRPRVAGISKYGTSRLWSGLLDTLTTYFIIKFAERPLHLFGTIAALMGGVGFVIITILSIERIFFGELLYRRPLLWGGILLVILGVQLFTTGLIAELMLWEKRKNNLRFQKL